MSDSALKTTATRPGDDAAFSAWLEARLRAAEADVDSAALQRLARARAAAVAAAEAGPLAAPRRWLAAQAARWLWLPPAALAAVLALAMIDLTRLTPPAAAPVAGEWLADGESPEFYQSLDFIEWLDEWAGEA